jgi:solute:Na+ symporter, SSS family
MTVPDVCGRHFRSRSLEIVTALALLCALIPWGQYQFIGLEVVLGALGLHISPLQSVPLAAVIAFVYLVVSGVRSPAFVSILKDAFMLMGIVLVGLVALSRAGGTAQTFTVDRVPHTMTTLSGSPLVFAVTNHRLPEHHLLSRLLRGVPLHREVRAGDQAVNCVDAALHADAPLLVRSLLLCTDAAARPQGPEHCVHEGDHRPAAPVAGRSGGRGAGLSGILVLAVTALSIGGIVTRNLVPNVRADRQKRISNMVVAAFLVLAGALTLSGSTIMLTVLNLTYCLLGQLGAGLAGTAVLPPCPPTTGTSTACCSRDSWRRTLTRWAAHCGSTPTSATTGG